ncbi:carbohydrate porin, partial [Limibaculum sp. M0105]
ENLLRGPNHLTTDSLDFNDIPQIGIPEEFDSEIEDDFATVRGYWYTSYSFYQYIDEIEGAPDKGWGVFGEAAISDGNPNPVRGHWYLGLGGNSFVPGRSDDLWGIAIGQYIFSNPFKRSAAAAGLFVETESLFEIYYNVAVAPWARLSANLQVVNPALAGTEPAVFLGLRGQLKF